jgi:Nitronate monooxygenase
MDLARASHPSDDTGGSQRHACFPGRCERVTNSALPLRSGRCSGVWSACELEQALGLLGARDGEGRAVEQAELNEHRCLIPIDVHGGATFRSAASEDAGRDNEGVGALLERLGVEMPVVQGGMGGGLSGHRLAAAVSAAGGLGTIGILDPGGQRS